VTWRRGGKAIVIGTMKGRDAWADQCVASLGGWHNFPHDITLSIQYSGDFELSVIGRAAEEFDEFIFLPDSTYVLDRDNLFEECFNTPLAVSLSQFPCPFGMYLGKYISSVVKAIGVPHVPNKLAAVRYETEWTAQYARMMPYKELGTLDHSDVFVKKNGRMNMVCENRWLRRYKASWDGSTMMREHERIEASR
jgi:hypothetical protein